MKNLLLSACLVASPLAATAEPKDPAQVAADWKSNMAQALSPLLAKGPLGLTASGPGAMTYRVESPPAPVFGVRPAPQPETAPPPSAAADKREVLVVPGDLDPKILHEASGDLDPKILHRRGPKQPPPLQPFKPIDPRLQPPPVAPAETAVPGNK